MGARAGTGASSALSAGKHTVTVTFDDADPVSADFTVREWIYLETHCGLEFRVRDSKHGRGKRQIKHGCYKRYCKKCRIPDWKIEKHEQSTK